MNMQYITFKYLCSIIYMRTVFFFLLSLSSTAKPGYKSVVKHSLRFRKQSAERSAKLFTKVTVTVAKRPPKIKYLYI